MVTEKDKTIGIGAYSTKAKGIGGKIKQESADFIVQEITPEKEVASLEPSKEIPKEKDEYVHFTLVKRDWNEAQLIQRIARSCGISRKRFSYAGTKDKRALTSQRVSAWKIPPETLAAVSIKDCTLGDFSAADQKIELGDHWGNQFTITIRETKGDNLDEIKKELENLGGLPNFFGHQRFGMRLNNHVIGKLILKNDLEGAVKEYLIGTTPDEQEEGRKARLALAENWGDFKQALKDYPRFMRFERAMLDRLNRYPSDFVGTFKQLSKNTYKLFTHAYQSYLFNQILTEKIKSADLRGTAPLIGYETEESELVNKILEKEELSIQDFRVKPFPEASTRGTDRSILAEIKILEHSQENSSINVRFSLEKGAYATIFLREVMKN